MTFTTVKVKKATQPLKFNGYNMKLFLFIVVIMLVLLISCNNSETPKATFHPYGIGPIEKLELKPISDSLMKHGKELFDVKCSKCHTMEYKNTGPDISDILWTRKPEWVLNFMLNKDEMLIKDSFAIKTQLQHQTSCNLTIEDKEEALAILEYLRMYQVWLHEFNAK